VTSLWGYIAKVMDSGCQVGPCPAISTLCHYHTLPFLLYFFVSAFSSVFFLSMFSNRTFVSHISGTSIFSIVIATSYISLRFGCGVCPGIYNYPLLISFLDLEKTKFNKSIQGLRADLSVFSFLDLFIALCQSDTA
jgi:hypothetical protein